MNPFLLVLMYSTVDAVTVADLCLDMWIDARLLFLTRFGFVDTKIFVDSLEIGREMLDSFGSCCIRDSPRW